MSDGYTGIADEAAAMIDREEYPQAIKLLNEALSADPSNAELFYQRGRANTSWSGLSRAQADFERAISLEPAEARYHVGLGLLLLEHEAFDDAASSFARARHIDPHDLDTRIAVLHVDTIRGAFDEVVPQIEQLHREFPDDERLANMLAVAYAEQGVADWERTETDEGELMFALTADHVAAAERCRAKVAALQPRSETVEERNSTLAELIAIAKKRTFQGGFSTAFTAFLVLLIGAAAGGFSGTVYALSAVVCFYAFRRPAYVANDIYYHDRSDASIADRVTNFIGGDWMVFAPTISGVIVQQVKIAAYMQIARAIIVGVFLPFSVFAALRRNYDLKQAGVFAAVAVISGFLVGGVGSLTRPAQGPVVSSSTPTVTDQGAAPSQPRESAIPAERLVGAIPVLNSGFEQDRLGPEGWSFGVAGWQGDRHGVMTPSDTLFTDGAAPEGAQLAFLSRAGSRMAQVLPIEAQQGWRYALHAVIAQRMDAGFEPGNLEVQIRVGSEVLQAETFASPQPGGFGVIEVIHDSGEPGTGAISIAFRNLDARQISIDDVRFYAWPAASDFAPPALQLTIPEVVTSGDPVLSDDVEPEVVPARAESAPVEPVAELPAPQAIAAQEVSVPQRPAVTQQEATLAAGSVLAPEETVPVSAESAANMPRYWHMRVEPMDPNMPIDTGIRAFWDKGVYVFFNDDGNIGFNTDDPGPYFYQGSKTWVREGDRLDINLDGMPYALVLAGRDGETLTTVDGGPGTFRMLLYPRREGER